MTHSSFDCSFIYVSPYYESIYYGLVLASGCLAGERDVCLLFSMDATCCLLPEGWKRLKTHQNGVNAEQMNQKMCQRNRASFEELIESCAQLGGRFVVCDLGLDFIQAGYEDLWDRLSVEKWGVMKFLSLSVHDQSKPPIFI